MTISQSKIGEIKKKLPGGAGQRDLSKNAIKKGQCQIFYQRFGSKASGSLYSPKCLNTHNTKRGKGMHPEQNERGSDSSGPIL